MITLTAAAAAAAAAATAAAAAVAQTMTIQLLSLLVNTSPCHRLTRNIIMYKMSQPVNYNQS